MAHSVKYNKDDLPIIRLPLFQACRRVELREIYSPTDTTDSKGQHYTTCGRFEQQLLEMLYLPDPKCVVGSQEC